MTQRMGEIFKKQNRKRGISGLYSMRLKSSTHEFHDLLAHTMDKALHCEVIISTPLSLLDHMIREAEEAQKVFKLMKRVLMLSPADATIHEK